MKKKQTQTAKSLRDAKISNVCFAKNALLCALRSFALPVPANCHEKMSLLFPPTFSTQAPLAGTSGFSVSLNGN